MTTRTFANDEARRRALGAFLRAQREGLTPAEAGIATGARRRTPGLRREEVAQLGGVSATWYTWLEQGRDVAPSALALARLAMALRLTPAERRYLFDLAGRRDPDISAEGASDDATPDLQVAVDVIGCPAYAIDRLYTARAWNSQAARLFVGWLDDTAQGERNLLRYVFLSPAARKLIVDWEERARRVIAEFRADAGARIDAPEMRTLIDELRVASPVFAKMWDEQAVLGREGGERRFRHPSDGMLRYDQIVFAFAARPDLKLVMLTPKG